MLHSSYRSQNVSSMLVDKTGKQLAKARFEIKLVQNSIAVYEERLAKPEVLHSKCAKERQQLIMTATEGPMKETKAFTIPTAEFMTVKTAEHNPGHYYQLS